MSVFVFYNSVTVTIYTVIYVGSKFDPTSSVNFFLRYVGYYVRFNKLS